MSADTERPTACIVCGVAPDRALKPTQNVDGPVLPYAATLFQTQGHYGSTVYDPLHSGEWLYLNVCDNCLLAAASMGQVQKVVYGPRPLPEVSVERWNPDAEGIADA